MTDKPTPICCAESIAWLLQRMTDRVVGRVAAERDRGEQRPRVPVS